MVVKNRFVSIKFKRRKKFIEIVSYWQKQAETQVQDGLVVPSLICFLCWYTRV